MPTNVFGRLAKARGQSIYLQSASEEIICLVGQFTSHADLRRLCASGRVLFTALATIVRQRRKEFLLAQMTCPRVICLLARVVPLVFLGRLAITCCAMQVQIDYLMVESGFFSRRMFGSTFTRRMTRLLDRRADVRTQRGGSLGERRWA